ncbi:MAG: cellulase family glycosylhydrolase [Microthrixaceae bacterium]
MPPNATVQPLMTSVAAILARQAVQALRIHDPRPAPQVVSRARWSVEQAQDWSSRTPWLVGANFSPSTAGNQLEMWQADTFDLATIDRELGWAAQQFGMNSMRIFLHDLLWQSEGQGFLDRVEQVLEVADSHGISVMFVLFDGIWNPRPIVGPQREPKPFLHNSTWLQSPGAEVIANPEQWDSLRSYVEAVIGRFAHDPRVVVWDLFNEPDSPNPAYRKFEPSGKTALIARLLEHIFDWAAAVNPDQPLTVGIFNGTRRGAERSRPAARVMFERSDVLSFHCYEQRKGLEDSIRYLSSFGRPLLCTEWMGRPRSSVDLLEVLAEHGVAAFNWGLVDGRSQTKYPWTSWYLPRKGEPEPWFHDLLHADGTVYSKQEAACFRRVAELMKNNER